MSNLPHCEESGCLYHFGKDKCHNKQKDKISIKETRNMINCKGFESDRY